MKRLWLTWDGNKITAAWKGRIWQVDMDGDPLSAEGFKLHMRSDGKTDVVVPWEWDMAHKKKPEWVDIPETCQDALEAAEARWVVMMRCQARDTTELSGMLGGSGRLSGQEALAAAEAIFDEAARMGISPDEVLHMATEEAMA